MKSKSKILYSVIVLGDKLPGDDLGDCLTATCTNMITLEKITGIKRDRLVYVFTRLGKNVLVEGGNIISKSNQLYIGDQAGRKEVPRYTGFNRNI